MTTQNTKKPENKLVIGILLFLIFLMVIINVISNERGSSAPTQQTPEQKQSETMDDIDAYIQGQYYVKQSLKSPSTAEFPSLDFIVHRLSENRYEVISYVDSQNSFGAMLRNAWDVVFQYQNGKTYLEKMIIDGKTVYQSKD